MHAGRERDFPTSFLGDLFKTIGIALESDAGKVEREDQLALGGLHAPAIQVWLAGKELVHQFESMVLLHPLYSWAGWIGIASVESIGLGVAGGFEVEPGLHGLELFVRDIGAKPESGHLMNGIKAGAQVWAELFGIKRSASTNSLLNDL